MINRNDTQTFWQKRLVDNIASMTFGLTDIAWPNVDFDHDGKDLWVRMTFLPVGEEKTSFGRLGCLGMTEFVRIEVFAKRGGSTGPAKEAAKLLGDLFYAGFSATDSGIALYILRNEPFDSGQFDATWHRETVQFLYSARSRLETL